MLATTHKIEIASHPFLHSLNPDFIMIHQIILASTLIASLSWSATAAGQGSLRGLGTFNTSDPQTITITVDMDVPDSCDAFELLNGPILSTLNGEFSTLTGHDGDTGTVEVSLAVDNSVEGGWEPIHTLELAPEGVERTTVTGGP
jgi:hypothetical protein